MLDLEITDPRPAGHWREHNARQIARLRPEAQGPFSDLERECWQREGLHVVLVEPLVRTDAQVFELYKSGREIRAGQWVLVDPSKWRTNAVNALQTAHGERRRAGGDWAFLVDLRLLGARPGVAIDSWHPSHPWPQFGAVAERCRLKWGGRFPKPDLGHVELPEWRSLPLLPPPP
jgi:hypothetical protein